MGNFNKVAIGLGTLSINSVDVGYLKDSVDYHYEYDIEKFYAGIPQKLQGQVVTGLNCYLTAKYAELSAANLSWALGGLTVTANTSGTVPETAATYTFESLSTMGLDFIQFGPGSGLAKTFVISAVTNTGGGTTYTNGTDYLLDPVLGRLYRNPTGAIASLASVKLTGTYSPITGNQINLGTQFSIQQVPAVFTHTRPQTGFTVIANMWKSQTDGKVSLKFAEKTFVLNDFRIDAVEDTTHGSSPFGYLFEQTA